MIILYIRFLQMAFQDSVFHFQYLVIFEGEWRILKCISLCSAIEKVAVQSISISKDQRTVLIPPPFHTTNLIFYISLFQLPEATGKNFIWQWKTIIFSNFSLLHGVRKCVRAEGFILRFSHKSNCDSLIVTNITLCKTRTCHRCSCYYDSRYPNLVNEILIEEIIENSKLKYFQIEQLTRWVYWR